MRKKLWGLAILGLLSTRVLAQDKFEKGYYIDNKGQKTEGLIKNLEWLENPVEFEFKTNNEAAPRSLEMKNVKEFEINDKSRYIRAEVNVDRSSDDVNLLSDERNPVFVKETVFLKSVVGGKYSLYEYIGRDVKRFYYQVDNDIQPLVYKKYFVSESQVAKNEMFIDQLKTLVETGECNTLKVSDAAKTQYTEKDLKKIFIAINTCGNATPEYKVFEKKDNGKFFHLSVRPGINFSSLDITSSTYRPDIYNTDFGSKTNFRMGVEAEFVMPFNNNKWAFIVEPTYQYFNAEKNYYTQTVLGETVSNKSTVKYSSIELPFGIRYYTYLNKNSKIFLNVSFIFDGVLNNSKTVFEQHNSAPRTVEIVSSGNVGFGAGYYYKNKYSIELNLRSKRNFYDSSSVNPYDAMYKNFSVILGYRLF